MDHDEIITKLNYSRKVQNLTYQTIAKRTGYTHVTIMRLFKGKGVGLFVFLDVLDAMGIEIKII